MRLLTLALTAMALAGEPSGATGGSSEPARTAAPPVADQADELVAELRKLRWTDMIVRLRLQRAQHASLMPKKASYDEANARLRAALKSRGPTSGASEEIAGAASEYIHAGSVYWVDAVEASTGAGRAPMMDGYARHKTITQRLADLVHAP